MAPYVENNMPTAVPTETTVNYDYKGFWREGLTAPDFSHDEWELFDLEADPDQPWFLYVS